MSIMIDFLNWRFQDPFSGMRPRNGQIADNFSCLLFHLIAKADHVNKERLRAGFPKHVEFYERWCAFPHEPSYMDLACIAKEMGVPDNQILDKAAIDRFLGIDVDMADKP